MKALKLISVFKVKVNYKSGASEVFECTKFSIKAKDISWLSFNPKCRPLDIAFNSVDDIESVWQVGVRKVIVWK